jgi:hypothetical protein
MTGDYDVAVSAAEASGAPDAPPAGGADRPPSAVKEPQIEFLCPNGHHLHGPASLQGRPGECPECGSRFRIPVLDELGGARPDEQISLEEAPAGSPPAAADAAQPAEPAMPAGSSATLTAEPASSSAGSMALVAEGSAHATAAHPLGQLFARFWALKGPGSRVEVHLNNGGVVLPEGFVPSLSQQTCAVLLAKDPDDSYTVTIIPWDTVVRVILRGVKEMPGEAAQ